MITTALIYWVTDGFVTSAHYYADAAIHRWVPSHDRSPTVEAPTGVTLLGGEKLPGAGHPEIFRASGGAAQFNLKLLNTHLGGGHFGHHENPEACIADIRAMFRPLRR